MSKSTIGKSDLIRLVAEKAEEFTQKQVAHVVDALLEAVQESVADGHKVSLAGFGAFEARRRSARQGRNPQTGEVMQIPEAVVPAFTAFQGFKDLVKI